MEIEIWWDDLSLDKRLETLKKIRDEVRWDGWEVIELEEASSSDYNELPDRLQVFLMLGWKSGQFTIVEFQASRTPQFQKPGLPLA